MADTAKNLELIASLALLDIDKVNSSRKGKAQDGAPLTDEELAFRLFAEEANSLLVASRDAVLAESIDSALRTDAAFLRAYAATEAQEARDRNMAFSLSGKTPTAAPSYSTPGSPILSLMDLVGNLSILPRYDKFDMRPDASKYHLYSDEEDAPFTPGAQASSSRMVLKSASAGRVVPAT